MKMSAWMSGAQSGTLSPTSGMIYRSINACRNNADPACATADTMIAMMMTTMRILYANTYLSSRLRVPFFAFSRGMPCAPFASGMRAPSLRVSLSVAEVCATVAAAALIVVHLP